MGTETDAVIRQLREENAALREALQALEKQRQDPGGRNPRGAGRKAQNSAWMARYNAVGDCIDEGLGWRETMSRLQISRSTYYRFRKICLQDRGKLSGSRGRAQGKGVRAGG